ncbi:MAG: hypothetical protein R3D98_10845 [Candidatus Krumholzibacteriia bacterium]
MRQAVWAVVATVLVLAVGCGSDDLISADWNPTPPSDGVLRFVEEEGFAPLQYAHRILDWNGIEVFRAAYGEGLDCPSGCFYSQAYGLGYGNRIGWLGFEDFHDYEPDSSSFFDFVATDSLLFDVDTWFVVMSEDWQVCFDRLLPAIAGDSDSSRLALITLSTLIYTHESVEIAELLVQHPVVVEDREILGILSNLPVIRSDVYQEVRLQAQELLDDLS